MDRAEKAEFVASLKEVFTSTSVVVVAHYSGLTVAQMQDLRKQMAAEGASVKVAKNRLAKIALEGTDVASVGGLLTGPTLLAYSSDPVAAAKVAIAPIECPITLGRTSWSDSMTLRMSAAKSCGA